MVRIGSLHKAKLRVKVSLVTFTLSTAIVVYFGSILYSISHLDSIDTLNTNFVERNLNHAEQQPRQPTEQKSLRKSQPFTQNYFQQLRASDSANFLITAFTERPLNDTVPGTGSRGDLKNDKDHGTPPNFVIPLPLRTHNTPDQLQKFVYPNVRTCRDMPQRLPVDRGLEIDPRTGDTIVRNVGSAPQPSDYPLQEAPFCPVELDPFLPWIHDVFPSPDGSLIEFIAQNKRRCHTGKDYDAAVQRLVPQVTLLQPISVQRLPNSQYRLSSVQDASPDGRYTRFICRFHVQGLVTAETLSVYPFNYEAVAFRKQINALLTPKGKDSKYFWTSHLHFQCPVPPELQLAVANGWSVLDDGTPTVFVDVVPIRTR